MFLSSYPQNVLHFIYRIYQHILNIVYGSLSSSSLKFIIKILKNFKLSTINIKFTTIFYQCLYSLFLISHTFSFNLLSFVLFFSFTFSFWQGVVFLEIHPSVVLSVRLCQLISLCLKMFYFCLDSCKITQLAIKHMLTFIFFQQFCKESFSTYCWWKKRLVNSL